MRNPSVLLCVLISSAVTKMFSLPRLLDLISKTFWQPINVLFWIPVPTSNLHENLEPAQRKSTLSIHNFFPLLTKSQYFKAFLFSLSIFMSLETLAPGCLFFLFFLLPDIDMAPTPAEYMVKLFRYIYTFSAGETNFCFV